MVVRAYWYIQFFKQIWQNSPAYGGWKSSGGDQFKIALMTSAYVPNQDLHVSKNDLIGEVLGQGYNPGGQVLTNKTLSIIGNAIALGASSVNWTNCIFTARWAVIYDDTNASVTSKQLVRVVDFGEEISLSGENLKITFDGLGVLIDITPNPPVDATPPDLEAVIVNGQIVTVHYDEPLDVSSVPAIISFSVVVGTTQRAVTLVAMTATAVALELAPPVVAADSVFVSYTAPASTPIKDLAGNLAVSFTSVEAFNVTEPEPPPSDITPPIIQAAIINGAVLALNYDEPLNTSSIPGTSLFQVFYNGVSRSVTSTTIQGASVILVISVAATAQNVVTLNYTAGVNPIEDLAGNNAGNLSLVSVLNNTPGDTTPPALTNLVVNGAMLTLTYNEALITTAAPATSAYAVMVNSSLRGVTLVTMSSLTVTLSLSSAVTDTDTVRISYTAPASVPVRDLAGNAAANFLDVPVTNTTPPSVPTDEASFVSQSVSSLSMQVNTSQNVSVIMRNDGTAAWSSSSGYHLYSQNPDGNTRWGLSQVPVQGSILSSSNCVFTFNVTAPATTGSYSFQWRMRHGTTEFGAISSNVTILVADPPQPGLRTIYVAKNGSDSNVGSSTFPFLTIKRGIADLTSGDTLIVRSGTYAETDVGFSPAIPSGISNNTRTIVKAAEGETVIIKPSSGNAALTIYSRRYIDVQGLICDGTNITGASVYIGRTSTSNQLSQHIRLIRCEVRNTRDHTGIYLGIRQEQNDSFLSLIDCKSHDNGVPTSPTSPYGVYCIGRNNLIDGGDYYNNNGMGLHVFSSSGAGANNGTIVRNTRVYNNSRGVLDTANWGGIGMYRGENLQCYNNIVYGNKSFGITTRYDSINCDIFNNTVYNNEGSGLRIGPNNTSGTEVRNNICYQNTSNPANNIIDGGSGTIRSNNLDTGVNPQFVNASAGDFHLQSGSPAINAGFNVSTTLTTDFDGRTRTQPFDIGAYEFVP